MDSFSQVSKVAKQFLTHFDEQALINVKECNPKIYSKMKPMKVGRKGSGVLEVNFIFIFPLLGY